jgi:hypothetical protein
LRVFSKEEIMTTIPTTMPRLAMTPEIAILVRLVVAVKAERAREATGEGSR